MKKTCPSCRRMIQDQTAIFCTHCGRSLLSAASSNSGPSAAAQPKKTSPVLLGCLGLLAVLYLVGRFVTPSSDRPRAQSAVRQNSPGQEVPISSEPQLELVSWSWSTGYGYATAEGQVRKVSTSSLKNVQAVASFYTKSRDFITSGTALIEYNPILPGQTSPFKVMARHNPAMHHASIRVQDSHGRDNRMANCRAKAWEKKVRVTTFGVRSS